MKSMSVSEFRAHMRDAMEHVERGGTVEITRDGKVAAVLVHPRKVRGRARAAAAFAAAERLRQELAEARARPLPADDTPGLSVEYAEDLVRWIRAGRDRRR